MNTNNDLQAYVEKWKAAKKRLRRLSGGSIPTEFLGWGSDIGNKLLVLRRAYDYTATYLQYKKRLPTGAELENACMPVIAKFGPRNRELVLQWVDWDTVLVQDV